MLDPQTEASLFRDDVLQRFYASIEAPPSVEATPASTTDPPAWDAEMELWAFASST